jgi:hypothetical protein
MRKTWRPSAFVFFTLLVPVSLAGNPGSRRSAPSPEKEEQTAVLVGAGDIADCRNLIGAESTAKLLDQIFGTVMAVGDLAYPDGSKEDFVCYDKTWGRARSRTRPAPGNHEFHAAGATPYFAYFGGLAGDPKTGYYSYDLGAWHIVVLNSECKDVGGCEAGSPQERWLRADLASHPVTCTLAYWHRPLFSSGSAHGNDLAIRPLWDALYDANADVVINGHDHDYERFAPQTPGGAPDPVRGIREFVVGTGGKGLRPFGVPKPHSEARNAEAFGVLKLTLHAKSYDWQFVPEEGRAFQDAGSGVCH